MSDAIYYGVGYILGSAPFTPFHISCTIYFLKSIIFYIYISILFSMMGVGVTFCPCVRL